MDNIYNEMIMLKKDILDYMALKSVDFETTKSTLGDVSRFSTIEDYSKMLSVFDEMKIHGNFYLNAKNFLMRLESISNGINLQSNEKELSACVAAYLILKSTDEYRIIITEINKRFEEQKSKGLK